MELNLSKHRITLLLAVLSALGTFLVLVRESTYGVGVSPDSVRYISNVQYIRHVLENGQDGYNSRTWAESEIIAYMNENPGTRCMFFSANASGLSFLTAQPRQFYLPRLLTATLDRVYAEKWRRCIHRLVLLS